MHTHIDTHTRVRLQSFVLFVSSLQNYSFSSFGQLIIISVFSPLSAASSKMLVFIFLQELMLDSSHVWKVLSEGRANSWLGLLLLNLGDVSVPFVTS